MFRAQPLAPLRYMDRYVTIRQGEVFYMTEALARLEGMERGPAGNTSLAAAFSLAQAMPKEQIIVVQETEYTGAGKHVQAQLSFAQDNGIEILRGDPVMEIPGTNIVLPEHPSQIKACEVDMDRLRRSYIRNALEANDIFHPVESDVRFLADDTKIDVSYVNKIIADLAAAISILILANQPFERESLFQRAGDLKDDFRKSELVLIMFYPPTIKGGEL